MFSPTPTTVLTILIITFVMIIWWRITLLVVGAILVTVLIFGLNEVVERMDAQATVETAESRLGWPLGDDGNVTQR